MSPQSPPDPVRDPRWDRLIHLVAGELPAEEAAALRRWVEADAGRREALALIEEMWRVTGPAPGPEAWDAEAELRRIRAETGGAGRVIARVGPNLTRLSARRSRVAAALRIAAVLLLVAGGGFLWRLRTPVPIAMTEYKTAPRERLTLHLPDGTRVMLAPGGVLRRPSTYGVRERVVHLEGEGYFVVTHDSTRPFAVHTARVVARDLGTRFVVRAYPDEAATDVVVAEGSVAVGRAATTTDDPLSPDSLVATARQRATVTAAGRLVLTRGVALGPYLSWTEGRLVFQATPLREVVRRLERWYGIAVQLADPALGDLRLTATLEQEGPAQAVDLVATSLELSVSRSGSAYVLSRAAP